MKCNVGKTDRIIRIVIGVIALLIAFFGGTSGALQIILIVVGIIGLGTGIFRFCALYTLLGMNTCQTEEKPSN